MSIADSTLVSKLLMDYSAMRNYIKYCQWPLYILPEKWIVFSAALDILAVQ